MNFDAEKKGIAVRRRIVREGMTSTLMLWRKCSGEKKILSPPQCRYNFSSCMSVSYQFWAESCCSYCKQVDTAWWVHIKQIQNSCWLKKLAPDLRSTPELDLLQRDLVVEWGTLLCDNLPSPSDVSVVPVLSAACREIWVACFICGLRPHGSEQLEQPSANQDVILSLCFWHKHNSVSIV